MVGDIFFNLFIMPLKLLFEIVFSISYRLFSNPGISILFLSLVMNFMVLPLYKRADAIQEEEKNKVNSMSRWVSHIRKTFKGDERYMMLNEYYRQEGYKPLYSLRSSFSLLLQVPFFIAAYNYLSNLSLLKGMSFLIFKDLGAPDGLITIGSFSINIMPIIMTIINVGSAYVYLRGFPLRNKIQTYAIAAVFLVLLYNSPSGLVFYWTLNQIFSLCKNLIMKAASRKKEQQKSTQIQKSSRKKRKSPPVKARLFILGAVLLTIFLGIVIPLSVISSSPIEFETEFNTPFRIVLNNVCIAAGVFIIWMGIFYYLAKERGRRIMTYLIWTMSIGAIVNFLFFGTRLGTMSAYLVYDEDFVFSVQEPIFNIIAMVMLAFLLCVVMRNFSNIVQYIYAIAIIGMVALSVVNTVQINASLKEEKASLVSEDTDAPSDTADADAPLEQILPFSTEGRNVLILMMDRAMSGYLPYMFEEKPELAKEFDGFTYYPNTLAYGGHTNFGVPPIFGGYEYTPEAMNARDNMKLGDKHCEALKVMPTLFTENGFDATLCDTAYANYKWVADMSFYDDMEHVKAYNTIGKYASRYNKIFGAESVKVQTRNFFMYSVLKSVPLYLQYLVYDEGNYFTTGEKVSFSESFMNSYSVLLSLKEITKIEESDQDNYLFIDNESTHEITLLKTPEYEPGVTNVLTSYDSDPYIYNGHVMKMDTERRISHYHVNMASFLRLGEWFEYLKEQGVYDNTRIIIVSDHGYGLGQFDYMVMPDMLDVQWYNSMLMIKDFGSTGELITDDSFMTAADVPVMAMKGLVEDLTNPFTGNDLIRYAEEAKSRPQAMTTSHLYAIYSNNGYKFDTSDGKWFTVHDNIFDIDNWEEIEPR